MTAISQQWSPLQIGLHTRGAVPAQLEELGLPTNRLVRRLQRSNDSGNALVGGKKSKLLHTHCVTTVRRRLSQCVQLHRCCLGN